ncbi:MAG: Zn-dependent hydrolase [Acidaminococcus sp.]|nr:Zn-dependent hydrolase [Acidaminococcus sp.]MCI2114740.1 Zn-dependent hydrolase [Acidaminococcus sp.]MCI2116782.1 Zn-dependent hydrolase [Acidaminococcus sp.]
MSSSFTLWKELFTSLAKFGFHGKSGTTRLSWSSEFMSAQNYLLSYAKQLSLPAKIDAMGNLWITYPGKDSSAAPLYVGSHVDSVPDGGSFDGALGVSSALATAALWKKEGYEPTRPVQIIGFAEEEGTRFGLCCLGSQAIAGKLAGKKPDEFVTKDGQNLEELLKKSGLTGDPFEAKLDKKGSFLELHIEQGGTLEEDAIPLGIVSAIVGINRYMVTVSGEANHAGTTAMNHRHDALAAASECITALYQRALDHGRQYVATVGHIEVEPDAMNVIPGKAVFSLEFRSSETAIMENALAAFKEKIPTVEKKYGVTISVEVLDQIPPVPMDKNLMKVLQEQAEENHIPYEIMPSWAGHDSMIIGRDMATAMLFVPSIGGISHSPKEFTKDEDIEKALIVLDGTMRALTK